MACGSKRVSREIVRALLVSVCANSLNVASVSARLDAAASAARAAREHHLVHERGAQRVRTRARDPPRQSSIMISQA